jgi:hypothetical protein
MHTKFDLAILFVTFVSFLLSVYLWFGGQKEEGLFVAIWVPSLLSLGVFLRLMIMERSK